MDNIFVIRVPLSYLNAVEAQAYFNIPNFQSILVVLYKNINDVDILHIRKILDSDKWKEVHYLPYNVDTLCVDSVRSDNFIFKLIGKLKRVFQIIKIFERVTKPKGVVNRVFIGDCHIASMRHIVNSVQPFQTILLDEGGRVTTVYEKVNKRLNDDIGISDRIISIKYKIVSLLIGYKIHLLKNVFFFTAWPLPKISGIRIIENHYTVLRNNLKNIESNSDIYFLGSSALELGYIEKKVYLLYFKLIAERMRGKSVIYIPHRDETEEQINLVLNVTGFKTEKFDMPIEYVLCTIGPIPQEVCSFFSSALFNLHRIFGESLSIRSFYIENEHFLRDREFFKKTYDELLRFQSQKFRVVPIFSNSSPE